MATSKECGRGSLLPMVNEAARRGEEYFARWRACAPAAFSATMDALGRGDDPKVREAWKASLGLIAGTCMSIGTCGAVSGAVMALSHSFGFTPEDIDRDPAKMLKVLTAVTELGKRVQEAYGHIQCQEIQFSHWGKSYRFTNPDAFAEFRAFEIDERSGFKCRKLTGEVSGWAVESILKHNPGFRRRED